MSIERREIDLRDVVMLLWARRIPLIIIGACVTAAFVAYAFLKTPIYRATVVVADASVGRDGGLLGRGLASLGGLASLTGLSLGANQQGEEALAVLRSREFTQRFIADLNLMPVLYADLWDPAAKTWKGDRKSWPTPAQASKFFNTDVRAVVRDKLTGLISLEIEWRDPQQAASWANELISRLNSEMRTRTIAHTDRTVKFLNEELTRTSTIETREAINRLMEAQINERMLASVTNEYAFRVVDTALPPDPRDIAKPRKFLLVLLGPIVGFAIGAAAVFFMSAFRRERVSHG